MIEANFSGILSLLGQTDADVILIGGGAGVAHGLARATYDVDVVYARDEPNLGRLIEALKDHSPYLRGAPAGLPFRWGLETLRRGLNFTLTTAIGNLDLLGEVTGGGDYYELLPFSEKLAVFGVEIQVVNLPALIRLKRAAGRPKDLEVLAELEAILEERERGE